MTGYVFVDGNCFAQTMSEFRARYDEPDTLINWNGVRSQAAKVFYYDALPEQKGDESDADYDARIEEKREELRRIAQQPHFHVKNGIAKRETRRRPYQQKMVDILLAVDALSMAHRGAFDVATIITGDLDFEPLIRELVSIGIEVHLLYPPRATNEELILAADVAVPITSDLIVGREWVFRERLLDESFPITAHSQHGEIAVRQELVVELDDPRFGQIRITRDVFDSWEAVAESWLEGGRGGGFRVLSRQPKRLKLGAYIFN